MDIETSEAIGALRADLRRVEDDLGGRIDGVDLRDDIRIVAEGVIGLGAKIERLLPPTSLH